MARPARYLTLTRKGGKFHVFNRVGGSPRYFPFMRDTCRSKFLKQLRYCLQMSTIRCASFTLMGNHFHLVLLVQAFRQLSQHKLEELAKARWGNRWKQHTASWTDQRWKRFNEDVFRLDCFMKDLQGPLASWFNKTNDRRGRLWADRYKSLLIKDLVGMQETLFYVELNPVRAGLKTLPEHWEAGSAFMRSFGGDGFLVPLRELFPNVTGEQAFAHYRERLLYRGSEESREGQLSIPAEFVQREQEHGFRKDGMYLQRLRFLTDGMILGSASVIRAEISRLRNLGFYLRRRNPVTHLNGLFHTLREQRSHARK